jgi:hypothetical protein
LTTLRLILDISRSRPRERRAIIVAIVNPVFCIPATPKKRTRKTTRPEEILISAPLADGLELNIIYAIDGAAITRLEKAPIIRSTISGEIRTNITAHVHIPRADRRTARRLL